MQTTPLDQTEGYASALRIFEQSEDRRTVAAGLGKRPHLLTAKAAVIWFLAVISVGAGLGTLAYADLNTYHPAFSLLWLYIIASAGAVTGCTALVRSILTARKVDAITTLLIRSGESPRNE
jgi:hypothetical protein